MYRGLSVLFAFSKITIKRLVGLYNVLYIFYINLLASERSHQTPLHVLLALVEKLPSSLKNDEITLGTLVDLDKAFDKKNTLWYSPSYIVMTCMCVELCVNG